MVRRFSVLFAVLAVGLIACWLSWVRGGGPTPLGMEGSRAATAHDTVTSPTALEAESAVVQRESPLPTQPIATPQGEASPSKSDSEATLVVRVIDAQSRAPLPQVRILMLNPAQESSGSRHVEGTKGSLDISPITGEEGIVEFVLPVGVDLGLWARGDENNAGSVNREIPKLKPGERRDLTIELPTGNDLHYFGRVLSRESKSPVVGATVTVLHPDRKYFSSKGPSPKDALPTECVTGSDGLFELWMPSWKNPELQVQAVGFAYVLLQVGKEHETPEQAKTILLSRSASLRVHLLDVGGVPIPDGVVRLWTEGYHMGEGDHGEIYLPSLSELEWKEKADSTGICLLQDLPPNVPFHVGIYRDGQLPKKDLPTLSLNPGEVREVDWTIGSGCHLEGSVIDQLGAAVEGTTLWLQRADFDAPMVFQKYHSGEVVVETRSGSGGKFAFSDVSPGKWWLGPAAERDEWSAPDAAGLAPVAQVVEVMEGSSQQEVVVHVQRGLYIKGQVLDSAGEPATETYIWGTTDAASWLFSARTEKDGTFAMGPLVPGRYRLVANGWKDANSEPASANGGDEGVVLHLRAGGVLRGTIVEAATGKGCAGKLVYASREQSNEGFGIKDSESNGSFQIEGLIPGTYDLAASASGRRVGVLKGLSVQGGIQTRDLVVTLGPGATLRVKYAGHEGYLQYHVISGGAIFGGDGIAAGGVSELVVPSGHLVVECHWPPKGLETKEIDVAVGEDKELDVGGGD